ncbi:MAG TPA: hypothetical protein IAC96_04835 [Candidatus Fimimorpha faecalis]|uniref:CRISPR type III-associated protein domain-containing protein n=1 Tax=Candidatus Fimimorpha faecalis TaxID=2840824 RepID=A0A9D1JCT1_9FIRM|nr:hypothetical protein [Candidatus Fimimorpha faecalis]
MKAQYNQVGKYIITAKCETPLHIGSAVGDKSEVLTHPVENVPFIQATSLAGVFRDYYQCTYEESHPEKIFGGSQKNQQEDQQKEQQEELTGSKIRFSDGAFLKPKELVMELRPRVKINSQTGTVAAEKVEGTDQQSGQKFEIEYVAAGAKFQFTVYLYDNGEEDRNFKMCLANIWQSNIQFGGQKSNGCGYISIEKVLYKKFDLTKEEDRNKWFQEDCLEYKDILEDNEYKDILKGDEYKAIQAKISKNFSYDIKITAKTDGELLVKGIAVTDLSDNAPDAMNIQNGAGEYIIPASSLKGAIRNRMEMIAAYKGIEKKIIDSIFGKAPNLRKDEEGTKGIISFHDTVIGKQEDNDNAANRIRIQIDKFTGGVKNSALFNERYASGDLTMNIRINQNKEYADAACGLLVLALRDMANGQVTVGSGYSIGKGFIDIKEIQITDKDHKICTISFANKKIEGEDILNTCFNALKEEIKK